MGAIGIKIIGDDTAFNLRCGVVAKVELIIRICSRKGSIDPIKAAHAIIMGDGGAVAIIIIVMGDGEGATAHTVNARAHPAKAIIDIINARADALAGWKAAAMFT